MQPDTLQDQPTEPRRVRFTDALGEVTEGELVQVTDFAVLIKTKVGQVARWTGGRFDLIPLAGGFKFGEAA